MDGFNYSNIALITWTGEDNPDKAEFEFFHNFDYEDYALSNYLGEYYKKEGTQLLSHWWPKIVNDLESDGLVESIGFEFMDWLKK